jgi:hypothetical protein
MFNTLFCSALAVLLTVGAMVKAQQGGTQTGQNSPQQIDWNTELRQAQEENRALRSIFAAIESIDTARQNELVQWIITDRSIRSRVISALRKAGKSISPNSNADLIVTQKPASRSAEGGLNLDVELLRIVIESVGVYGTPTIKKVLGEDLYDKIKSRSDYEYSLITTEPAQSRIQYANIVGALWGGHIIFKSGFGVGVNIGNDYLGYPFWMPGNVGVTGIIHKEMTHVELGMNFQLGEAGLTPFVVSGGFRIKERMLEGTQGFHGLLHQALDVIDNPKKSGRLGVGGEVYSSFDPNLKTFSIRANDPQYRSDYISGSYFGRRRDSLFYIGFSGHGWLTYHFGEMLKGLYIQAGAGKHTIKAATVGVKGSTTKDDTYDDIITAKTYSYFDPLVKVGYVHSDNAGDDWGVSLQYCNTMMAEGFVRVFTWLDLQAKYSFITGRDPRKWEWSDFVIVSPVLKLNF